MDDWLERHHDDSYRRLATFEVRGARVSTVWIGYDQAPLHGGAPLIFETLLSLPRPHPSTGPLHRFTHYATEAEAVAGHVRLVDWLTAEGGGP